MNLPFTSEQFFGVFANYNNAVWPIQIVLYLLALIIVYLVFTRKSYSGKFISAVLGFYWLWMGIAYHLLFFASINPAAKLFAAFFAIQGFIFFYEGVLKNKLEYAVARNATSYIGLALITFGSIVYPLLGMTLGHTFPNSPTFGLPCPTTIFTIGVLLLTIKLPKYVVIIPFLWSLIGFTAAVSLGVKEDVSLLVAGLIGFPVIFFRKIGLRLYSRQIVSRP